MPEQLEIEKDSPTPGSVHISQPLTNVSIAYIQGADAYVADKVFPAVPVSKQSDVYYTFSKDDFFRDEAQFRAPGTESAGGGFDVATDFYVCRVIAYHKDVDDQTRANADSQISLDASATRRVTSKMLIKKERQWAGKYFTTGVWGDDSTPAVLWDQPTAAPRKYIDTKKLLIQQKTGYKPNMLVLHQVVFMKLRDCPDIRDQFKYTSADSIDEEMMARYFGIPKLLVIGAVFAANQKGAAVDMQFIAGPHGLLCYTTDTPSLMEPTAGYTFKWTGFTGGQDGIRIKRMRNELKESDRIEGQMAHDQKLVASDMGCFLNGLVTYP